MKRRMLILLSAVLALLLAALGASAEEIKTITPDEALKRLEEGAAGYFVDVRTQEEYDEAHIPGAWLMPLDEIAAGSENLPGDKDLELYVYCRSGVRSREASQKLIDLGYTGVYDMGGIIDWPYETVSTEAEQAGAAFLGRFTAQDLQGNGVNQSIFADYDLTIVNVWATYCPPCLEEMPDLGKLSEEYKDKGVQVLGIVSDVMDYDGNLLPEQVELAKEIAAQTGAAYTHLLPSDDLINTLLWQVSVVPTTIFVDSHGNLVGQAYMGALSYEEWVQAINHNLSLL